MNDVASAPRALSMDVGSDGVAIITFDVAGEAMNTLQAAFADELERVIDDFLERPDARAAVLRSGKADSFIVGADITMIQSVQTQDEAVAIVERGHRAMTKLAGSEKPVVAAIHGPALGGGFEVALGCQARVLSDHPKTALGLPEVKLGLLPGLSGLQRLAALAGLQVALEHGLTGKNFRPRKARSLGIADDVVPASILLDVARKLALSLASDIPQARKKSRAPFSQVALEGTRIGRKLLFSQARADLRKKTHGHYPATERIVDVLECYADAGLGASQELEARAFGELAVSSTAHRLMEIFFAQTALKKETGVSDPAAEPLEVRKIAMIGAGLMGSGIAYVSLGAGYEVRLRDQADEALGRGLASIEGIYRQRLKKRQIRRLDCDKELSRLTTTTDLSGLRSADLVIEAVFEDLALKHRVLAEVEGATKDDAIFASNTSSIPIAKIASAAKRPERVVGMHYFSPVHKMPLLEVIRTDETSPVVVATAVAVGQKQGKTVIVVRDGVGFYTSRILGPYMNEAAWLLTEGATIDAIDDALVSWGWPVGPLTLLDEVGIDVAAHVGPIMLEAFGDRVEPPEAVSRLSDDGRKGKKNGRGFYLYGTGKGGKKGKGRSKKRVDESVYSLLGLDRPVGKGALMIEEMQMRCSLQLVNEAFHCLGERIVSSPRDGDIGAIFGLGFPPFRGGPFRYTDAVGPAEVLARIEGYHARFGKRWAPAPALAEYAASGKRVYG